MSFLDEVNAARGVPTVGNAAFSPESNNDGVLNRLAKAGGGGTAGAGIRGILNSLSFGGLDEANAGIYALFDAISGKGGVGENYNRRLEEERGMQEQLAAENPTATLIGEITGAILPSLLVPGAGATTLAGAIRTGAATSAAQTAAQSFGEGEGGVGQRLMAAIDGALYGAVAGGALGAAARGAGKLAGAAGRKAKQPAKAELRAATDAAFKAVEDANEVVPGNILSQNINDAAKQARTGYFYDPTSDAAKPIERVLNSIDSRIHVPTTNGSTKPVDLSFGELVTMRQGIWEEYADLPKKQGRRLIPIVKAIDASLEQASASGSDLVKQALAASRIEQNTRMFDKVFSQAEDNIKSGTGDAATQYKNAAKKLLRNEKYAAFLGEPEKAALQKIVDGNIPQNALRFMGRFAPTGGNLGTLMMLSGSIDPMTIGALGATHVAKGLSDIGSGADAVAARSIMSGAATPPLTTGTGPIPTVGRAVIQTQSQEMPSLMDSLLPGQGNQTLMDINRLRQMQQQQQGQ